MKTILMYLSIIICLLVYGALCYGEKGGINIENGFIKLHWGCTPDQARAIYPDLMVDKDGTIGSDTAYVRRREDYRLNNIKPDKVIYYFRNNRFYKVITSLRREYNDKTGAIQEVYMVSTFIEVSHDIEYKYGDPDIVNTQGSQSHRWKNKFTEITWSHYHDKNFGSLELEVVGIKEKSMHLGF